MNIEKEKQVVNMPDVKLTIPGPIPTINNMYSRNKQGLRFISKNHKFFKEKIYLAAYSKYSQKNLPVFSNERLYIRIDVMFARKGRDIDNIIKPIQDALKGVIFSDDKQIDVLSVHRISNTGKEKIEKVQIIIRKL